MAPPPHVALHSVRSPQHDHSPMQSVIWREGCPSRRALTETTPVKARAIVPDLREFMVVVVVAVVAAAAVCYVVVRVVVAVVGSELVG